MSQIQIEVRLFANLREKAGARSLTVTVPEGSTALDVIKAADQASAGQLGTVTQVMYALNREYVDSDAVVQDGDELALIPPVSGGAPIHTGLPDGFQNVIITVEPLDPEPYIAYVTTEEDGAVVTFLGVTRNRNDGRDVEYLEYEAYRPMADEQMQLIIDEMKEKWEIGRVAVAHRTGRVDIGETSMVLAVGAPHRRPAFESSLYFVDRLKEIVPIWKKEVFKGGEVWIGETPGSDPH